MSDAASTFLLTLLLWWVLLFAAYTALVFGIDALLSAHVRRQHARQQLRVALARIDRRAEISIDRIGAASVVAQRLIGEEVKAHRGETR